MNAIHPWFSFMNLLCAFFIFSIMAARLAAASSCFAFLSDSAASSTFLSEASSLGGIDELSQLESTLDDSSHIF